MLNTHFKALVIFLFLISLISCSTPYQSLGKMGGYSDSLINAKTAKVSFYGNVYTSNQKVADGMLYRCAEVTLQNNFDYFEIVNNSIRTYTFYISPEINDLSKRLITRRFALSVEIKMFVGKKPLDNNNAYDARELIHYTLLHGQDLP